MHINTRRSRYLTFVGMGLFVALAPLACGSDDDDDGAGGSSGSGGSNVAGTAGKTGAGGGSSGDTSIGGAQGGDFGAAGMAGMAGMDMGGAGGAAPLPARLRVVHASPNAPSVDIYAGDSLTAAAADVEYGDATDFIEVEPGPMTFELRPAGADATDAPAFTSAEIDLSPGADYTVVATGDFSHPDDADTGFRLLPLEHDFDAAAPDHALARVVHATSGWATVACDFADTTAVDVPELQRFDSESNVSLEAGTDIGVSFSSDADGVLSQLTLPEVTDGEQLFIIATGNPGFPFRAPANGFALLVVDEAGHVSWVKEKPWLHLVHASDISTVDVYDAAKTAASAKLVDDLEAGAMAGFQMPPSVDGFDLKAVAADAATGAATALATGPTSTLESGEHYLTYIAGDGIHIVPEQFDLEQPSKVLLRGVHASASVSETVDFGAANSGELSSALIAAVAPHKASAAAGLAINPGAVTLGAAATGTTINLLAEQTFSGTSAPQAGERDFLMLVGAGQLWLVDTSVAGWSIR